MSEVPPAVVSWARVEEILARPPVVPVDGQIPAFEVEPAPVVLEQVDGVTVVQLDLF